MFRRSVLRSETAARRVLYASSVLLLCRLNPTAASLSSQKLADLISGGTQLLGWVSQRGPAGAAGKRGEEDGPSARAGSATDQFLQVGQNLNTADRPTTPTPERRRLVDTVAGGFSASTGGAAFIGGSAGGANIGPTGLSSSTATFPSGNIIGPQQSTAATGGMTGVAPPIVGSSTTIGLANTDQLRLNSQGGMLQPQGSLLSSLTTGTLPVNPPENGATLLYNPNTSGRKLLKAEAEFG